MRLSHALATLVFAAGALALSHSSVPSAEEAAPRPGWFVAVTSSRGVDFQYLASHTSRKYLPETMGAGVALFDYDNDGRLDIFLVNGAPLADPTEKGTVPEKSGPKYWNRLFHQKADGVFEDVTEKAGLQGSGYGMGVAVGDYDNDGFEDLYVTALGGNKLYHNNGNGTFTDVTEKAGVAGSGWSTSAAWVDLDNDGLLDLVVLRYLQWDFDDVWCGEHKEGFRSYCHPDIFPPITPLVFHNDGNGHFNEVSQKIGLSKPGKGLGIALGDYDHGGKIDLFVANDSMVEFLYHNKGDGTFEEVGLLSQVAVDGDGRIYAGMGVDFADYNNDGWKDLIVAQGHDLDTVEINYPNLRYKEPMLLLRNTGTAFVDVSAQSGSVFQQRWLGRGLAVGDIDNDGRIDVVVSTNDGPAHILHNETPAQNHWLTLNLVGHKSNRDAIGAEVQLTTAKGSQFATVTTTGSYLSSSDKRVHFGLGPETTAQSLEIRWPSGLQQKLSNLRADQILQIDEPPAGAPPK